MQCSTRDGGMALRSRPAGGGFKPPHAALAEDRRGERCGNGAPEASGGDREDERERIAVEVSLVRKVASKPGCQCRSGMSLAGARFLARWCPACRRREPGLLLTHRTWEGASRYYRPGWGGERECPKRAEPAR